MCFIIIDIIFRAKVNRSSGTHKSSPQILNIKNSLDSRLSRRNDIFYIYLMKHSTSLVDRLIYKIMFEACVGRFPSKILFADSERNWWTIKYSESFKV